MSEQIPNRLEGVVTTATQENSTTLAEIQRKARNAKRVVMILVSLATVALAVMSLAPWNLLASLVLFVAAVVVAWATNSMTPEEIDALVERVAGVAERTAVQLNERKTPQPPQQG